MASGICEALLLIVNIFISGRPKLTQAHIDGLGTSVKLQNLLSDGIIEYVDVSLLS